MNANISMQWMKIGIAILSAAAMTPSMAADAPKTDESSREQMEQRLHEAQERLDQAAHEVAELSMSLNDRIGPQIQRFVRSGSRRAMLGIGIEGPESGAGKPGEGVRVISVSPGGPAEAAGLKANDVIVSFNGKTLRGEKDETPQRQLLSMLDDAKPGEPVTVEYRRDGKVQKAQIVPKNLQDFVVGAIGPMTRRLEDEVGRRVFTFERRDSNGFGATELVELSPGLGKYFGSDKGLLVVRAPRDERFKLQDGDVILDIDGRVTGSVSHAFQILSSYGPGEKLKLHILRQQKRMELQVDVPNNPAPSESRAIQPSKGVKLKLRGGPSPEFAPTPSTPGLPAPPEPPEVAVSPSET